MSIWTLEIEGLAVVVIGDIDHTEAQDIISDDAFQDDLEAFESDGRPVWDGEAELTLRPANADEQDVWRESRLEAEEEEDFQEDEASVVFLIPVSGGDEDFEDD